jgi:hypothetical protein
MTLGPRKERRDAHSLHVVPAKAGTHTLRLSDAEGVSHLQKQRTDNNHRWLWVPAFAGTTVSFRTAQAVIQRKNP